MKNNNDVMFYLDVDYEEGEINTYKGIVITKKENDISSEIIKINTGDIKKDESITLDTVYNLFGEVPIYYMSSYDNYFMDVQYETDPEFKAEVDEENKKLDYKIEKYMKELGKEELTKEELNYIINLKD